MRFKKLADALDEIALHYRLIGRDHVGHQYQKASKSLRKAEFIPPDPSEIDNIGQSVRDDIAEWRAFGEIDRLTEMRRKRPYLKDLTRISKVGPKTAKRMYKEAGAETIEDVRELAKAGELEDISGIGPKTAETIRRSIAQMKP